MSPTNSASRGETHSPLARRTRPSSHDLPGRVRRAIFLIHRWLGVALALLMAMWAASGVVMMYVAYPETTAEERLASLAPLDLADCCAALPELHHADGAAVEMLGGRPVLQLAGSPPIDLRSGTTVLVAAATAEEVARTHLARSRGGTPKLSVRAITNDQWTVTGQFRGHAPLYKISADDAAGTELYISSVTGQVVQDTTRYERVWNWFGAIPHWLYFKQLRENGPLWSKIVIYGSLLGAFLTVIGLYIGIVQFGRGKRLIPYRGMAWWHHVTGLVFGLLTLTWTASGLFSMNPWGWMESQGPGAEMTALAQRPADREDVAAMVRALAAVPAGAAVRAELSIQAGQPFPLLAEADGTTWRASLPDLEPAPLRHSELDALAARARPGQPYAAGLIREPDAYYYGHKDDVALPAWRVIYHDEDRTRFYFDPKTGELVGFADAPSRAFRWWHLALHRFDFAAGLRLRPVWDIVVLPLMLGVTLLTLVGLWLGVRRLWRTVKPRRKKAQRKDSSA